MDTHHATPMPTLLTPLPRPDPAPMRRLAGVDSAGLPRSMAIDATPAELGWASVWDALWDVPPLTPAERAMLTELAQARVVAAGQGVLNRHGPAQALVALARGEVALGLRTADGTFRTERIVRAPAWLDLGSAWLAVPHAVDGLAMATATLLELPCAALQQRLAGQPALALRLVRCLAREVQALSANTHELMHKDAPARLAQWLHQRLETPSGLDAADCQGVVRLHERKRDVAAQLAITPETLSRLMRSFTRQGVIDVAGYTLRVRDIAALARLAEG